MTEEDSLSNCHLYCIIILPLARNIEGCLILDVGEDSPPAALEARSHGEDVSRGERGEETSVAAIAPAKPGAIPATACSQRRQREPEYVRNVVIGCDVAKHTDWTVLIAMDAETGRCFAMERFNHLDWPIQKERILGFVRRYRGRLILDASGVGDPIFDDLKRVYGDIEAFKFTAGSKTELVQRLIVAVEQRKASWPCVVTSTRSVRQEVSRTAPHPVIMMIA